MSVRTIKRVILRGRVLDEGAIKDLLQETKIHDEGIEDVEVEVVRMGDDGRVITEPKELVRDAYGSVLHIDSIRKCRRCGNLIASHNYSSLVNTCRRCAFPQLLQDAGIGLGKGVLKSIGKLLKHYWEAV